MLSTEPRIEHVVLLMLENRSFDHMLGFLPHPDPTFRGVRARTHYNIDAAGSVVWATNDGQADTADPDHSNAGVLMQLGAFGDVPAMGGFVRNYGAYQPSADAAAVMRCLDPLTVCPVVAQLALEFAVCDAWFSSVPGETWPNRNFAHAATSDDASDIELGFYYDPTIFEQLASVGASWRIYHDGPAQAWCFRRLWHEPSWLDRILRRRSTIANWFSRVDFAAHAAAGDLPAYTFIEPTHLAGVGGSGPTNSQHPNNNRTSTSDFVGGEQLVKEIYDALAANPDLFAKTLFVITYDEHGGLYDHVPPPAAIAPGDPVWRGLSRRIAGSVRALINRAHGTPSARTHFDFTRLGVRVPAVLVSPWIQPGTVVHTQLEHASIPATLRALFAPRAPALTRRDAAATTFHGVVREHAVAAVRVFASPETDLSRQSRAGTRPLPRLTLGAAPPADGRATVDGPPPRSDFDRQLIALSRKVDRELAKTQPVVASDARGPADARPAAAATERFSAAATSARRR